MNAREELREVAKACEIYAAVLRAHSKPVEQARAIRWDQRAGFLRALADRLDEEIARELHSSDGRRVLAYLDIGTLPRTDGKARE